MQSRLTKFKRFTLIKQLFSKRNGCKIVFVTLCLLLLVLIYQERPIQLSIKGFISSSSGLHKKIFHQMSGRGSKLNYSISDVDTFIQMYQHATTGTLFHIDEDEFYLSFLARINARKKQGRWMKEFIQNNNTWAYEIFHQKINQYYLYDPNDNTYYDQLLKDLHQRPLVLTDINNRSSHLVLTVTFDNGAKGVFKFIRTPRDHEVLPNHFFFSDIERPNAEIASFHLDKVLGFYRVPPTVGRVLNITRDIKQIGVPALTKTLHISPVGNLCFYGKCKDYCKVSFSICGTPDTVEGSMSIFVPNRSFDAGHNSVPSPWMRVYSPMYKAEWEKSEDFCDVHVKTKPKYKGRRILDFSDFSVFDFLTGNLDRHHYEFFKQFGNDTFLLHFDNGRGFGKSKYDCLSCLAPVRQCCLIRLSTLAKLVKLYIGPDSLSHVLRESLSYDPLSPVLWEPHLDALDRRVGKIIKVISDCIKVKGKSWSEVVIDDGFN